MEDAIENSGIQVLEQQQKETTYKFERINECENRYVLERLFRSLGLFCGYDN